MAKKKELTEDRILSTKLMHVGRNLIDIAKCIRKGIPDIKEDILCLVTSLRGAADRLEKYVNTLQK